MKKIILMLLLAVLVVLPSGCSNEETDVEFTMRWKECGEVKFPYSSLTVFYDTETKVMYAWGGHSLTVLMNPDGTPMLYEED